MDYNITLPRFKEDGGDRIAHRYAFAQQVPGEGRRVLTSPASWVTDLTGAAERSMPRLVPANKKGLGGIAHKAGIHHTHLSELGITASTVNIKFSRFVNVELNVKNIEYTR